MKAEFAADTTKEKIIKAAIMLFSERGFDAVSVKDIADSLSLTKSALYKHYKDKRDIYNSIVSRMECEDSIRAGEYGVPEKPFAEAPEEYKNLKYENVAAFSRAQFVYWTEDGFASRFRRMLSLERFSDAENYKLYSAYFLKGPLGYTEDMFAGMTGDRKTAEKLALSFYCPMYFLYSLSDGAGDKSEALKKLDGHLRDFALTYGFDYT